MNLKALIAAAAVSTAFMGGAATAEAKPHEKKAKKGAACARDYRAVELVELGPGHESYDLNSNYIVCYSEVLGITDDQQR